MNIAIVGLGLIGGSIAKAIKYNTDNTVYGYDIDRGVLLKAKLLGAVDEELTSDILPTCDIVILGLYPNDTLEFVRTHADKIKKRCHCYGFLRRKARCLRAALEGSLRKRLYVYRSAPNGRTSLLGL